MKHINWLIIATSIILLASCRSIEGKRYSRAEAGRWGFQGPIGSIHRGSTPEGDTQYITTDEQQRVEVTEMQTVEETVVTDSKPKTSASTKQLPRDIPYGTPVPGKPGFVASPHAPYAGYVDVRGHATGSEVGCPYTKKLFLVP